MRLARITKDARLSAKLAVKTADLEARAGVDSPYRGANDSGIALNKDD